MGVEEDMCILVVKSLGAKARPPMRRSWQKDSLSVDKLSPQLLGREDPGECP